MASFSSLEISSMISSKKYKIKRGDSLSELADKFQHSFPSAKCINKYSLMNKIYEKNQGVFLGSQDLILEGFELDLKFLSDCRAHAGSTLINKNQKEYVFTNEDRLMFAIKGPNNFWDDFIKADRVIGELFKMDFKNSGQTSLPESMPMPMNVTFSSGGGGRKILEEIKKTLSGQIVSTTQITEAFLKMTGKSFSNSLVRDLAIRLEKENNVFRSHINTPCSAMRDKLEQLSSKTFEDYYCKTLFDSKEKERYIISKLDVGMGMKNLFQKVKNYAKVFLNGKLIKGNETLKEGDCIVCVDNIEGTVYKFQGDKNWDNVDGSFKEKVINAMCELYCMYKKEGKTWTILEITSAYRTPPEQANVMVNSYLHKGPREMSRIYASRWDNAVDLISDLYYDGNHLNCKGIDIEGIQHPCVHGSSRSCTAKEQKALLHRLPSNEQSIFSGNINLKGNKEATKKVLEAWIVTSNILSNHTIGKALDFSRRNNSQHGKFDEILRKSYNLKANKPYPEGNFHVESQS